MKYLNRYRIFEELQPSEREKRYGATSRAEILDIGAASHVKDVVEEYAPWYDLECKTPIYRGRNGVDTITSPTPNPDFMVIEPSKHKRRTAYASGNYYTEIIDNSIYWRNRWASPEPGYARSTTQTVDYPKRGQSIICTTDAGKARAYGEVYRVIPITENARFAVCPENDIFDSFPNMLNEMNKLLFKDRFAFDQWTALSDLNSWLDDVIKNEVRIGGRYYSTKNSSKTKAIEIPDYSDIKNFFQTIGPDINDLFVNKIKLEGSFLDVLEKWMSPEFNKFSSVNYDNQSVIGEEGVGLPRHFHGGTEVWTDANCLLIKEDTITDQLYL